MKRFIRNLCLFGASVLLMSRCVTAHDTGGWEPLGFVGSVSPFGSASETIYTDVWGSGSYAYLGTNANGVAIIDISDPTQPVNRATVQQKRCRPLRRRRGPQRRRLFRG